MTAEYVPSSLNVHADWESQNAKDNSEWKLDVSVFQDIVTHMGQLTLDLLASRLETRPGQYSNRCIPASSGQGVQFCFSSIQLDKSRSKEDPTRKNRSSNYSDTHLANSALVFSTSKNV